MSYPINENIWGVWNNFSYGSIFAFLSLYVEGSTVVKRKVKYPLIFACIMAIWEITTFVTGWNINDPRADVGLAFCLVGVLSYFAYIENRKA